MDKRIKIATANSTLFIVRIEDFSALTKAEKKFFTRSYHNHYFLEPGTTIEYLSGVNDTNITPEIKELISIS